MASQLLSAFLPLVVSNRHQESFWVVNNRACSIQGVQKEEYSESYEVTRELSGKTGDTARKSSPRVWTAHPEHEPAPAEGCVWVGGCLFFTSLSSELSASWPLLSSTREGCATGERFSEGAQRPKTRLLAAISASHQYTPFPYACTLSINNQTTSVFI